MSKEETISHMISFIEDAERELQAANLAILTFHRFARYYTLFLNNARAICHYPSPHNACIVHVFRWRQNLMQYYQSVLVFSIF